MAVQWLGVDAFTAKAWVPSLVGELRSCKPRGVAKKAQREPMATEQDWTQMQRVKAAAERDRIQDGEI